MGDKRDKNLTEAIVDAWKFEHRFNEKFHKRDDFNKVASSELRSEVDWLLKTTKKLRSKSPIDYEGDAKQFSRRAKRALDEIEDKPPSERGFAAGGWAPPEKSSFLPNLIGLCLASAVCFWLFSHCNAKPGAVHDASEWRVHYH
jgi:hypothetical protein